MKKNRTTDRAEVVVSDLRRRVDGELQFGLFAVVDAESLHQQRGEAGAGATAE